jgi:hypothetical protein
MSLLILLSLLSFFDNQYLNRQIVSSQMTLDSTILHNNKQSAWAFDCSLVEDKCHVLGLLYPIVLAAIVL